MDGTLTKERSSWDTLFDLYHHNPERYYRMYSEGLINQDEWATSNLREIIRVRPELSKYAVERALVENSHLRTGVEECISDLNSLGVKCVIISSGTEPLAKWIGERAGFFDWQANWFESDEKGHLITKYIRRVSFLEKEKWVRFWQKELNISKDETLAVGDSCNDVGMFLESGHSIAFNPTDDCTEAMGEVVCWGDDLRQCKKMIDEWAADG
jgi:phosphoserine phosphatase